MEKTLRKIGLLLFGVLVFGVSSVSAFFDIYSDLQHQTAINFVKNEGIVGGHPDGSYRPLNKINRAEFLKIVMEAADKKDGGANCFLDVKDEWFAGYVCGAKSLGIVNGHPDGSFRPRDNINVAEALKIIFEGMELENAESGVNWYDKYLTKALTDGYLNNVEKAPAHLLTRGEMAQVIYNIMSEDEVLPVVSSVSLVDNEYPDLPPGDWDWDDGNNDFANYRNFEKAIGHFEKLVENGIHYGWKLVGNNPGAVDFSGPAAYFLGSAGVDVINLGALGKIHSYVSGDLGDGRDVLVFDKSWTLDFRTGSSLSGSTDDDDLVIAGCKENFDSAFDINTTTIHTGPGRDAIFVRDMERSAIDAGNGAGGETSVIDYTDGDDVAVFHGNMADFRFFGGNGNDTAFWFIDEVIQSNLWLYPNFFGGGGSGQALWADTGTDRLVLGIPASTEVVSQTPTGNGQLLVRIDHNYPGEIEWDKPVYEDLKARYCIRCGESQEGEKTMTLEYKSANGKVNTGYFYVTDFEELQVGVGEGAKVYRLDDVSGKAVLDGGIVATQAPAKPVGYCQ